MYRTINGWTKERMKDQIRARNTGKPSIDPGYSFCLYESAGGLNHCAVGCFIPPHHEALQFKGSAGTMLRHHNDLLSVMPLQVDGLLQMQDVHDSMHALRDMRDVLCDWIDLNVEDSE